MNDVNVFGVEGVVERLDGSLAARLYVSICFSPKATFFRVCQFWNSELLKASLICVLGMVDLNGEAGYGSGVYIE